MQNCARTHPAMGLVGLLKLALAWREAEIVDMPTRNVDRAIALPGLARRPTLLQRESQFILGLPADRAKSRADGGPAGSNRAAKPQFRQVDGRRHGVTPQLPLSPHLDEIGVTPSSPHYCYVSRSSRLCQFFGIDNHT